MVNISEKSVVKTSLEKKKKKKKIVTFLTTNTDANPVMFHMNRNSKLTQLSLLHGFGKMGTQCSYIFSIGKMKLFCFAKSTR